MQIVILAGGLGTRLKPLTEKIPKPLIKINNKPFLEYQILMLKKYGFKEILLLVGYLGEQIENYFGDGSIFGVKITYNYETKLYGTGGALKLSENKLQNEFILIYGDSFLDYNYNKLGDFGLSSNYDLVLTVYDNKNNTDVLNNLEIKDSKVIRYEKGINDNKLNYVESGVLFVKKKILNNFDINKVFGIEEYIFPQLISKGKLGAFITNKKFYDIGTFDRLSIFKNLN